MVKLIARDSVVKARVPGTCAFPIHTPCLSIIERPYGGILRVQANATDPGVAAALLAVCGVGVPGSGAFAQGPVCEMAWAGPKETLVFVPASQQDSLAGALRTALENVFATVTVISDSRACVLVSGPAALDFLAKGCAVDCDPTVFTLGAVMTTRFAHQPAMLIHERAGYYRLYVEASFIVSTVSWLVDAAKEFSAA